MQIIPKLQKFINKDKHKNCLSYVAYSLDWISEEPSSSTDSMCISSRCLGDFTIRNFLLRFGEYKGSCSLQDFSISLNSNLISFRVDGFENPNHVAVVSPDDPSRMIHRYGYDQPIWELSIEDYLLEHSFDNLVIDYWNIPKFEEQFFIDKFRAAKLEA